MKGRTLLNRAAASLMAFWSARQSRERTILVAGAAALLLVIAHTLLVAPALHGRKKLSMELPELRLQVAQMQAMAKEAASLTGKPTLPAPVITREGIEASLQRSGLAAQIMALNDDSVQLRLSSASFSALLRWLDETQNQMLLTTADANIVALPQLDKVDATLLLHRTGND